MHVSFDNLGFHVETALTRQGVSADAPLVAAVSGGADSMALLAALLRSSALRARVIVGHVDHGVRAESGLDAAFVREYCAAQGVPFHETRLNVRVDETGNLAARLRELRYTYLLGLVPSGGYLLTAHHADDQAVTMLMRLIEGAALPGLSGMAPRREQIVRPLLHVPAAALRAYLKVNAIAWREDASNGNLTKFRNRVRNDLWPRIDNELPGAAERLANVAARLREDDAALQSWAEGLADQATAGAGWVEVEVPPQVPPAVLRRVINTVLNLRWNRGPLLASRWQEVHDGLAAGARQNLPGRITVQRRRNHLVFLGESLAAPYEVDISAPGDYVLPVGTLFVTRASRQMSVRGMRPGDRLLSTSGSPVAVGAWLRKSGLPGYRCAAWPVLTEGQSNQIVAVPPARDGSAWAGDEMQVRFESLMARGREGLKQLALKL